MECVIVGAGIVGCAVARELAVRGHDVLVLDRATVGAGASGGPGWRGVRANARDPRELPLAKRAYDLWAELGYLETGHLQLTERTSDLPALEEMADRQCAAGIPSRVVDRHELNELEPELATTVIGALWCERDGIADHTAMTAALANAARTAGVEFREHISIEELRVHDDHATLVTIDGDSVDGEHIVIATNASAGELVELPIFAVFPQVIVTTALNPSPVRHLIGHQHRRLALKTLPTGEVMVSGGRLGSNGQVDSAEVDENMADAAAVYPGLAGASVELADASRAESIAPDMVPIIDLVPGTSNATVATGWSGHGWAIAPAAAEAIVEWIITGIRPDRMAPFSADRFG